MLSKNSLIHTGTLSTAQNPQVQTAFTSPRLLCTLRWRQQRLWVTQVTGDRQIALPALASESWFRSCLAKSRAKAVCMDPALGTEAIWQWANACHNAHKPLYLRIPSWSELPHKQHPWAWRLKRVCDFTMVALLMVILAPLMLLIAGVIWLTGRGPVLATQWRVGARGRMFQVYNFRTTVVDYFGLPNVSGIRERKFPLPKTALGAWLAHTHLDKLPLLLNVLRGDISLVGPHPWAIFESVTLPVEYKHRLHILPGITGSWQVFSTDKADITQASCRDIEVLKTWSLGQDAQTLLQTLGQILR